MTLHFQKEIEKLKQEILHLSAIVEDAVYKSVKSAMERDSKLAEEVIEKDNEIDEIEVEVEEECLKILALHQPVAIDLRFIIAVLKINSDLERIGDLAVNIATQAIALAETDAVDEILEIEKMSSLTKKMLKNSLDALVNLDVVLAGQVGDMDDEVDNLHRKSYNLVKDSIRKDPKYIDSSFRLLAVSKHLERIADYATNIAEDVIYMIDGKIIRHRGC